MRVDFVLCRIWPGEYFSGKFTQVASSELFNVGQTGLWIFHAAHQPLSYCNTWLCLWCVPFRPPSGQSGGEVFLFSASFPGTNPVATIELISSRNADTESAEERNKTRWRPIRTKGINYTFDDIWQNWHLILNLQIYSQLRWNVNTFIGEFDWISIRSDVNPTCDRCIPMKWTHLNAVVRKRSNMEAVKSGRSIFRWEPLSTPAPSSNRAKCLKWRGETLKRKNQYLVSDGGQRKKEIQSRNPTTLHFLHSIFHPSEGVGDQSVGAAGERFDFEWHVDWSGQNRNVIPAQICQQKRSRQPVSDRRLLKKFLLHQWTTESERIWYRRVAGS